MSSKCRGFRTIVLYYNMYNNYYYYNIIMSVTRYQNVIMITSYIIKLYYDNIYIISIIHVVGHCLATKVILDKLLAT